MKQFGHMQGRLPTPDSDFIDLGRLVHAVFRYKWGMLGLGFAIALITGLFLYSLEPVYRASASIVLESQEANVVSVEKVYSLGTGDYEYTQTQYEILRSRNLAERVVRKLQLHKHPAFLPAPEEGSAPGFNLRSFFPSSQKEPPVQLTREQQDELDIQSVTGSVAAGLKVSPVDYSYIVYLAFESTHRLLAAQIVNTLAEEFINSNLETRLAGTLEATDWLTGRLENLKLDLRESEQALQSFREREGLVDIEGVTGLGNTELRSLSQRLEDTRKARIEAENIKKDVQVLAGASTEELMTLPAVLQHQLISELKRDQSRAERKVAELAKRYGSKHPKMIAAVSDVTTANVELTREVRKVVSGISREYEVALRNERQLQATWEARKSEMQEFNRKEFQLQELQRDVDTNRQLYDIFFNRIKSVSETGGFEKPHARIVDRALTPGSPVRPNKRAGITMAFIFGVLLGAGIAIVLDIMDNTVKSPEDVQDRIGSPLLGVIPKMKLDKNDEFEQLWENRKSHYAEAIRSIRTAVVLSGLDDPAKIIVVTSTVPGEGKSTTALNLGASLGQMEKTLVIGADLRRPSLAKKCGLVPNHRGLSHFVSGSAELEECIEYLDALGISVMPAGVIPPNPLEMISSKKFVAALQTLREQFDRIVLDSAPVQAVSDALILASYADSVIYVVKADATSASQVQNGISSMLSSNEPLTGVVLNQFDVNRSGKQYGGKHYLYDDYYQNADTA